MEKDFFRKNGIDLAKSILGKYLIRKYENKVIVTKIIETEAYMGVNDKGAHVYGNKKTDRTKPLYLDGGHIYVYLIYGMYNCLNLSANIENVPECVLIRGVEPITSLDEISMNRYNKAYTELSKYQVKNITNGPGKLCKALKIDRSLNSKSIMGEELEELGVLGDAVGVVPVGCSVLGYKYFNCDTQEAAHGRAPAAA
ncbi:DNA-3-methyladenine glycosylase, partial [Clostridioides difficile]|uniref:DNA-3-methyladenine glycosylase n=1 Tax=Clostridioides difficile TaxID=1496 RepID=UPI001F255C0F